MATTADTAPHGRATTGAAADDSGSHNAASPNAVSNQKTVSNRETVSNDAVGLGRASKSRGAREPEPKLSTLVSSATQDLSALVRGEIELAKAEFRRDAKQAVTGSGLFGVAGLSAFFALLLLSFAAAYGIHATGLSLAWSWLIVGGAYLLIALVCAGLGMLRFKSLRVAEATKRSTGVSIATLKRAAR